MMYKAKVAVCSDIHTKHTTPSERHVEFLNVKPWLYVKKPLGVKRLIQQIAHITIKKIYLLLCNAPPTFFFRPLYEIFREVIFKGICL
jgi:hypothetical protein